MVRAFGDVLGVPITLFVCDLFSRFAHQKPGGFNLWLTLVHFGSSITLISIAKDATRRDHPLTVNALPILPLLSIKNRILILRQHLFFAWHLFVPSLDSSR